MLQIATKWPTNAQVTFSSSCRRQTGISLPGDALTATPVRLSPSGAARSVTTVAATPATPPKAKKNHVTHAFLPLNRLIRTFPGTSKKPSAALLAPYLPKAYQPFLARLDFN
ncbi:hypothetical protein BO79DRAFT_216709 [Aspergillus costaricaensis CBS 115574]|uniref:Uncharacterized protein n=1 Tax=Aspergillus costaricaensis CBS 115574 TaxID=1448317 RepID=A0ACD1IH35_9EURO|nr:hypothetical protein BO79DRAFT_216709 [Aspergillus costaricaensis CBS 115574]RAK89876.1 hypothetical protein BO79DRAFT_216709 [Aspergillus costaricaensis CBS 115574]